MLLNYHELTMNESRNSPARQKQFLVICTVMATMFAHSCMSSGLFMSLDIHNGVFPGGFYTYRSANRDYAAAMSLHKTIRQDLELKSEYGADDLVYHIYLDDPTKMGGRRQRWTSGILVGEDDAAKEQMEKLLSKNAAIHANPLTADDYDHMAATELWPRLPYDSADLTAVDALVLNFPFTNGFVSSLVLAHRIIPKMRQLAAEKGEEGNVPVVISTCSIRESMCTHYAPLVRGREFLLGKPDTDAHTEALGPEVAMFSFGAIKGGIKKLVPGTAKYVDALPF